MNFRAKLCAVSLLAAMTAIAAGAQSTYTTGFEAPQFTAGDVDGQNGWGHISNSPTGGVIVPRPAGGPGALGAQSLAIRTRNSAFFGVANHLHSEIVSSPAGETGSTIGGVVVANPQSLFTASFWLRLPDAPIVSSRSDGRIAELNPSSKGTNASDPANRYAQVRLFNAPNTAAGRVRVELGWYLVDGTFTTATVATIDYGQWYRFDYTINPVDGLGATVPNDRFSLAVFDAAGTQLGFFGCASTWEAGWKTGSFGGGTSPRAINGFDFWSTTAPDNTIVAYIDNFTMTTGAASAVPFAAAVNGTLAVCPGGTTLLTANPAGGNGAITAYSWTDASNAVVATTPTFTAGPGTYRVAVTDSLCTTVTSAPVTVTASTPIAVSINGSASIPYGQQTTLTANVTGGSGTGTTYAWRDAANVVVGNGPTLQAMPGTYTVTVSDSCGSATAQAFVVTGTSQGAPALSTAGLMLLATALVFFAMKRF